MGATTHARSSAGTARRTPKQAARPRRVRRKTGNTLVEDIRIRAYEIYQQRLRNGAAGDAFSDWLRAEREVIEQTAAEPRGEAMLRGDQD